MNRSDVPALRLAGPAAVAAAVLALAGVTAAQTPRTIWDGIYTEEQAARGATLYAARCAQCHGDGLGGQESAPALTGTTFYSNWEGETLESLFERMRSSMPADKPGSLSRAQNADVLAHVLKVGGYPAGPSPVDGQAGALAPITIRMYKP
jgi:mono/diheme cytochrome c family protein